jgi:multiple sugar transport system permease protein
MELGPQTQGAAQAASRPGVRADAQPTSYRAVFGAERVGRAIFIWPALIFVLFLSIFPLIVSLDLSLSRLQLVRGGIDIKFLGLQNYRTLFLGSEQTHFLGLQGTPSPLGWALLVLGLVALGWLLLPSLRSDQVSLAGKILRTLGALFAASILLLIVRTATSPDGRPGTLVITIIYVAVGVTLQYLLGLGLAMLLTQRLPGRRFFRVAFLLPMMITPVGVAYMLRMLTDVQKGPFGPLLHSVGLGSLAWAADPWGARIAVMIGDVWQWTPFMFIVLLAALEAQDQEPLEAALVDGAGRWQTFRYVTFPAILPVTTTLVLIRMIEGFKIIDLPNILTNGGPGTATESLTLQAFVAWRSLDLGKSAAIAYTLLFLVTIVATAYVSLVRSRVTETA